MRCDGLVAEVRDWAAGLEEVHARIAGRFARAEPRAAGQLELDRCAVDGSHIRALKGGTTSAPHRSTAAVPVPSTT